MVAPPPGYSPAPSSANSLHVALGYVTTGNSGSPSLANTLYLDTLAWQASDVGAVVMIFGGGPADANGNPTPLWTTIADLRPIGSGPYSYALLTESLSQPIAAVQVVLYRELKPGGAAPYVAMGSMRYSESITNTGAFDFTVWSSDGSFIPQVGQPVLLTDDSMGDVFGGSIEQATASNTPGAPGVSTEVQCVSWDQILRRRLLMMTGAFALGDVTDTITFAATDPTQTSFSLSQQPTAVYSITLGGAAQTVAEAPDFTKDFTWSLFGKTLYQNAGAPPSSGNPLIVNYEGQGATQTPPSYSNMTAGAIASALVLLIAHSEGITVGTIVDGPLVDLIQFTLQDSFGAALDSLSKYTSSPGGGTFLARMGPRRQLNFTQAGATAAAPWNISSTDHSDLNVLVQVKQMITREKFTNAAFVSISNALGTSPLIQLMWGDNSTDSWDTTLPIGSIESITRTTLGPGLSANIVRAQSIFLKATAPTPPPSYDWLYSAASTRLERDASIGGWLAITVYGEADIVVVSGSEYSSIQPGNTAHWPSYGAYDGTVDYALQDVVTDGAKYICIQANGPGSTVVAPNVTSSPPWQGYWSEIDQYDPGVTYYAFPNTGHSCACYYGGRTYVCLMASGSGIRPDINPVDWQDITDQWWQYTILQTGEYLTVTYTPEISLVEQYVETASCAARAAVEAGSGEYDAYQDTSSTLPFVLVGGQNLARSIASSYDALTQEISVLTYRSGLMYAQSITVDLPEIQASGSFVVQSVELTDGDNLSYWNVTLIVGAIIGDWKNAIKAISGGSSSAGADVSGGQGFQLEILS